MSVVLQAVTGALGGWIPVAAPVPNPPAQAPPGLAVPVDTILGWGKWGVLVCGVAGLLICAGKMTIGHRNLLHRRGPLSRPERGWSCPVH